MPIIKTDDWNKCVENNKDPYGAACIMVARRVMEILDVVGEFDPHDIICRADKETKAGGITGFMAGCAAQMVSHCHSRGEEFKAAWNKQYDPKPREGVINPAILTVGGKE